MRKKFVFLLVSILILSGCGSAEAPSDSQPDSVNTLQQIVVPGKDRESSGPKQTDPAESEREVPLQETGEQTDGQTEYLPSHFFTFDRKNAEYTENDICLLTENRCDTAFFSTDSVLQNWVEQILEENSRIFEQNSRNLLDYAREIIAENGTDYFYTYSNYQDSAAVRDDGRVVSLVTVSHLHSGGPHPNTVQTSLNLDLRDMRVLRMEDVIFEEQAGELEKMVLGEVNRKFDGLGVGALFTDAADTIRSSMTYGSMTPYWFFDRDSFVVFYNQYVLGPYAAGIVRIELPYERLRGVLRDEFFPDASTAESGELEAIGDPGGRERILLNLGEENGTLYLSTQGTIREIHISEIIWVDETPVTQMMIYSASQLKPDQVLEIRGGIADKKRSFVAEYADAAGNWQMKFLKPDGLHEKP